VWEGGWGGEGVVEVVEEQWHLFSSELLLEVVHSDSRGDRRQDEVVVSNRRKPDPAHAVAEVVAELGGGFEREPRLADAAGAGQRRDTRTVVNCPKHVRELLLAADQRLPRQRHA